MSAGVNPLLSLRGALPVVLVALVAAFAVSAMAIAEYLSVQANGEALGPLAKATWPILWIARLNKILMPAVLEILRDPNVDQLTRTLKAMCAVIGIGLGTLPGVYVLLLAHGRSVIRSGGSFSVSLLRYLRWAVLLICAMYGVIGTGYAIRLSEHLNHPALGQVLPLTFGYFLVTLFLYCLLGVVIFWAYQFSQDWMRNRQRKKWQ